jgi:succinyl-diaminopimelate desuccinylase
LPAPFEPLFEGDEAFLWARERRPGVPLLVLAGHYDTVPAQENLPGRIEHGAVHGCGASDMKGGVAVALELVRDLAEVEPGPVDVGLLLFGREELPRSTIRSPRCSTAAHSCGRRTSRCC